MKRSRLYRWMLVVGLGGLSAIAPSHAAGLSVQQAMDSVVDRLHESSTPDRITQLDEAAIQKFLKEDERSAFATQFWCFDVNVPVVVSIMRHVKQDIVPFWLAESGFKKTDLVVKNSEFEYEVWQKSFPAGRVGLGINGFDKHRPVYFACVGPQRPGDKLNITNIFPTNTTISEMQVGSFTYHDWSDLFLTEVPDSLKGQVLLQTIRGRAREAHLIQAFRKTPFPSSEKSDQIVLTWNDDPRTTQAIQWRTSPAVEKGVVRYREKGAADSRWNEGVAEPSVMDDRLILNDRRVKRFTAVLRGLKPGTAYEYTVGGMTDDQRSAPVEFRTAPEDPPSFSFMVMSDTHNSPVNAELLAGAVEHHADAAFVVLSGDLVGTGQYRDDWDRLFGQVPEFFLRFPVVPAIGNHDDIDGLGADIYIGTFALPENGPKELQPERAYSFQYGNSLFLILDVTDVVENQTAWLEQQLRNSTATWKFAVFHFPPYSPDDENPDIVREWCPILERYHVDFVLSGHVHSYLRTHPLKDGKPMPSPAEGTIYLITVSVAGDPGPAVLPDYAAAVDRSGAPLYQLFSIEGNRLTTRAYDKDGNVHDQLIVEK